MSGFVSFFVDGFPLREMRFEQRLIVDDIKRIDGQWFLAVNVLNVPPGMYHQHGSTMSGCFMGNRICMDCGEEWSMDLQGFVDLQLKLRRLKK